MIQDIAPHRLANEYRPQASPRQGDLVFFVRGQELAVRRVDGEETAGFAVPQVGDEGVPREGLTYIFALDDRSCWLAPDAGQAEPPAGFELVHNRQLRSEGRGPRELMFATYTAVHLAGWYASSRFCGCCGAPMAHHGKLRAMQCTSCGKLVFPRINPAVIVCVCDPVRERIVITRYARGGVMPVDALVAGFIEIGETIEDCVRREVREELGLEVTNIRYYKSQPWGGAADILSGYWCDVVGDVALHRDESELKSAVWLAPDQIAGQPDDHSLTNEMMVTWRDAHLAT